MEASRVVLFHSLCLARACSLSPVPHAGHNVRMRRLRSLANHPITASGVRYAIAGTIVAGVYVGIPIALNGGAGVPLEAVIPIAYLTAVILHFNLQRRFVFRHVDEFALSRRDQILRYVMAGVIQYPTTAIATALLPELFGISPRATFVVVTLTVSLIFFLVLRRHIFHPSAESVEEPEHLDSPQTPRIESEVPKQDLLPRARSAG